MFLKLPELMLARDEVGTVIWILFVLFSIVSWAVKTFGNKAEDGGAPAKQPAVPREPPRRRQPRPDSVADEIRQFQEEQRGGRSPASAAGGRPAARPAGGRPPAKPPRPSRPVAEPRGGQRLPSQGQRAKPSGGIAVDPSGAIDLDPPGGIFALESESRRSPLANERQRLDVLKPHEIGSGVLQHTQEFMRDRLSTQVSADLKSGVAASVSEHLGSRAVDPSVGTGPAAVHPLARALRDPANVRQALVLSLILGPPPARQSGRGIPPAGGSVGPT